MKTRCYLFLERNVKNLFENESNVYASWILAGKEYNSFKDI